MYEYVAKLLTGAKLYFPNVEITYDKFHAMKIVNTAVDETRRKEQRTKSSRYSW
ncbi:transposase [Brevibacillus antibioticus]|uniref:Transposase n=1 Tax=Brevibacillus antibioticus TaxID=2570228 RepID=A0A4U2Y9R8_9BACL|nr:transposase [Brevibacillus antibioticus]